MYAVILRLLDELFTILQLYSHMMPSRPMDAKPLFHSGVALLRRRGFPFFLDDRMLALAGRTASFHVRPQPIRPPHNSRSQNPAPRGDRTEFTTPERGARERGQCSAAAPWRPVRPASVECRGAAMVDMVGSDRPGNDKFDRPVPVMSNVRNYT